MKDSHLVRLLILLLIGGAFCSWGCKKREATYPQRDITNVLVWGAGGGTDVCNRVVAAEMAEVIGVNINVVNKTGGVGGSVGLNYAYSRPQDGYTLCGLSESCVTAAVQGGFDKRMNVWDFFIIGGSPDVLSVPAESDFTDLKSLMEAAKAKPNTIRAGASASGTIHHLNLLALEKGTGTKFNFIPYPSSAHSHNAVLTGEVSIIITTITEQSQLIRSGKFKPLAVLTPEAYTFEEQTIPSAFDTYPGLSEYLPITQAIGFAIRKDAPVEVKATLTGAFQEALQREKFQTWARENHMTVSGKTGPEAGEIFDRLEALFSWTMWELKAAKVDPSTLNIPKP